MKNEAEKGLERFAQWLGCSGLYSKGLTAIELINLVGGNAAFARHFEMPLSSVEKVKAGAHWPQHRMNAYYKAWLYENLWNKERG